MSDLMNFLAGMTLGVLAMAWCRGFLLCTEYRGISTGGVYRDTIDYRVQLRGLYLTLNLISLTNHL